MIAEAAEEMTATDGKILKCIAAAGMIATKTEAIISEGATGWIWMKTATGMMTVIPIETVVWAGVGLTLKDVLTMTAGMTITGTAAAGMAIVTTTMITPAAIQVLADMVKPAGVGLGIMRDIHKPLNADGIIAGENGAPVQVTGPEVKMTGDQEVTADADGMEKGPGILMPLNADGITDANLQIEYIFKTLRKRGFLLAIMDF